MIDIETICKGCQTMIEKYGKENLKKCPLCVHYLYQLKNKHCEHYYDINKPEIRSDNINQWIAKLEPEWCKWDDCTNCRDILICPLFNVIKYGFVVPYKLYCSSERKEVLTNYCLYCDQGTCQHSLIFRLKENKII